MGAFAGNLEILTFFFHHITPVGSGSQSALLADVLSLCADVIAGWPIIMSLPPIQADLTSPTPLPKPSTSKLFAGVNMALPKPPRALLFDVFGTCVDWRTTVTQALYTKAHEALNSAEASLATSVRLTASDMSMIEWGTLAQQWRNSYKRFTKTIADDPSLPWKSVDEHHHDALKQLLVDWKLEGLWTDEEVRALSLVWHQLDPWPDSSAGIKALNKLWYYAAYIYWEGRLC
jgi:2-haloacid dehalogenase